MRAGLKMDRLRRPIGPELVRADSGEARRAVKKPPPLWSVIDLALAVDSETVLVGRYGYRLTIKVDAQLELRPHFAGSTCPAGRPRRYYHGPGPHLPRASAGLSTACADLLQAPGGHRLQGVQRLGK